MNFINVVSTKDLNRRDWLRYRQQGIGGSDVAGILSKSQFSSPLKVYLEKTRLIGDQEADEDNEAMRQGRDLEDYCAARFEDATGKKVRRINAIVRHPDYPFMIANLDRRVDGENAILECKTTNAFNARQYELGKIPEAYQLQCHHYMTVTGADTCYLAVVVLGMAFYYFTIKRDEEIAQMLINEEFKFWEMVEKRTPPEWDGSEAATEYLNAKYGEVLKGAEITLTEKGRIALEEYTEYSKLLKQLGEQKEQAKQVLMDELKEAEFGVYDNVAIVKRVWVAGRESLDAKKLKAEQPDIYQKYAKTGAGYARLELKGERE